MEKLEVRETIAAPIETVWSRYTDHLSWPEWASPLLRKVTLAREGSPERNGVGCVRVMPGGLHEEVLTFEPPKRMTYRIAKGGWPVKNHLGEVSFESVEGGTEVIWRCRFESKIPGSAGLIRRGVEGFFSAALRGLKKDLS